VTEYRIFPAISGPASTSEDSPVNLGTQFSVSTTCWITRIHYWAPIDAGVDGTVLGRVWTVTGSGTGTALAGTDVGGAGPAFDTIPNTTSPGRWRTATLTTPVQISAGTNYRVAILYPSGYAATGNFWANGGPGDSGITNGPLTAPSKAAVADGGQGAFDYGATYSYPANASGNGANYWPDVTVSDVDPSAPQTITPDSIAPTVATGSPTLTAGPVTISPAALASTAALGAPTLTVGAVAVTPDPIAPTSALGAPALTSGAVTIAPDSIPGTATVGTPTVAPGPVTVAPDSISPATVVGLPAFTPGATTVAPDSIAPGSAVAAPTLLAGPVTVSPASISGTATVGAPTVGSSVVANSIAPTTVVGVPHLTVVITPASIAPTSVVGVPALAGQSAIITPASIAPTSTVGAPAINAADQRPLSLDYTLGPPRMDLWVFGSLEVA
jgi:hypothetical protein